MARAQAAHVIAVVEDDLDLRRAAQSLLRSAGYRTHGFASAEAYLASRAAARAHCLLLDLQLPGMDGQALLERLPQLGRTIPVILVTADEQRVPQLQRQVELGRALTVLRKPFGDEALLGAVASACGRAC